jgi:hypothetical protein
MRADSYNLIRSALSRLVAGVASSVVLIAPLGAQQVTTTTLKAPVAEHPEPLTQPTALLELRDGRVLVADSKDRLLFIYDFAKETATQVSRQGSGPLEYQLPSGIFDAGDSIIVLDFLQQRMLILDDKGGRCARIAWCPPAMQPPPSSSSGPSSDSMPEGASTLSRAG